MNATLWAVSFLLAVVLVQAVCVYRLTRTCIRQNRQVAKLAQAVGEQTEAVVQLVDRLSR